MKVIREEEYSRESFQGYKLRVKIEFFTGDGTLSIDVYTTETQRARVWLAIDESSTDIVNSFSIVHWSTNKQDALAAELIGDFLNDI